MKARVVKVASFASGTLFMNMERNISGDLSHRVEYRRRRELVQKVQSFWRRRRDLRREEAERMRLIRAREVRSLCRVAFAWCTDQ